MPTLEGVPLNVFQRMALPRVLGSRFGLVQLPTGCGKTRLAAAAIKLLLDSGLLHGDDVVLVLSPRLVIREQIMREMEAVLGKGFMVVEVGSSEELQYYLTSASTTSVNPYLLVATPQLLVSAERRGLLQGVKIVGLVLDEVHHTYTGDETSEVVEGLVRRVVGGGGFAIGLTATPTKEALKLLGENLLYSCGDRGKPLCLHNGCSGRTSYTAPYLLRRWWRGCLLASLRSAILKQSLTAHLR